jgi:hypothetical protein
MAAAVATSPAEYIGLVGTLPYPVLIQARLTSPSEYLDTTTVWSYSDYGSRPHPNSPSMRSTTCLSADEGLP